MKCRSCPSRAVIELRRHTPPSSCSIAYCTSQVERAVVEHDMLDKRDRVLVAVSGGKDSLALWDILTKLGYEADGLYVGLGIDGYSDPSGDYARRFAEGLGAHLVEADLPAHYGYDVRSGAAADHRAPCSACGLSSVTFSTGLRSRAAMTWSPPATTSTTRLRS